MAGISEPQMATSSAEPNNLTETVDGLGQPYAYFRVAFLGRTGSGRNSLAWRLQNLDSSELPHLEFESHRTIALQTATRPKLHHTGVISITVRIVPPEDQKGTPNFFDRNGDIHSCDLIVFVVDLGDEKSSNDFYMWRNKVKRCNNAIPLLIVGNKADLRLFEVTTPYTWGEGVANECSARYVECSAKTNYRIGDVLDAILKILL